MYRMFKDKLRNCPHNQFEYIFFDYTTHVILVFWNETHNPERSKSFCFYPWKEMKRRELLTKTET